MAQSIQTVTVNIFTTSILSWRTNFWVNCLRQLYSATQQFPPPCGPKNLGPTECHVMGGAPKFCTYPSFIARDFHVFGLLKKALRDCTFMLDDKAVVE